MKLQRLSICLAVAAAMASAATAAPIIRPTNFGMGGDAEIREESPTTNRNNTELGLAILNHIVAPDAADTGDRNRIGYLQFDLSGISAADTANAVLRLTVRNNNQLTIGRLTDQDNVDPNYGTNGLQYWGVPGASFDETKIAYETAFIPGVVDVVGAPGITPDGDIGTRDFNSSAVDLGNQDFPSLGTSNGLYVGQPMDFSSAALDAFLLGEVQAGRQVAVIAFHARNLGALDEPSNWKNFNYLFNPKEQTTLATNPTWDADINDPNNPTGGPFSGADNSTGEFSPQLRLNTIPEPTSVALAALAGLGLFAARRR